MKVSDNMHFLVRSLIVFLAIAAVFYIIKSKNNVPTQVKENPFASTPIQTGPSIESVPTSFQEALATANKVKKPLYVLFTATWCPACKEMKINLQDPQVIAKLKSYVVYFVDTDKERAVARQYGIRAIPVSMIFDVNGSEVKRQIGKMPPQNFLIWLP